MLSAIILAAGKGTRMKTDIPKCAYPLLKKPLICYLLDSLDKANISERVCILGYKRDVLADIIGSRSKIAYQEEQLGTAHAVKCGKGMISSDTVIILFGDTPLVDDVIISDMLNCHIENKNDFTIGTIILDNPYGYGRIIRDHNRVLRITEEKDASLEEKSVKEVNTGVFLIKTELLFMALDKVKNDNAKGEYYLTDIVQILADKCKIGTFTIKDAYKMSGINDLYALSKMEEALRNEINKKHMLNGVNIINPSSTVIGPDCQIEAGTIIYPNCMILGKTMIGNDCVIGPNSEINNSVIESNASAIHSVINDSFIGKGASVGPFVHMRMNAHVGINDRIGNFVEIKNSTLGEKTNVAHLTYVGDTDCGGHVNFGCGTVTVNYDGKHKYRTIIGDNVFIGCNTNLIAPVKVESNTFIAAGSTITDDVPEDTFAIARAKQVNKPHYVKKWKENKYKED